MTELDQSFAAKQPAGKPEEGDKRGVEELQISDLLDLDQVQSLLANFCEAVGIAASIIDLQGNVLAAARWQRVCADFHRVSEISCQRCIESDTELALKLLEGHDFTLFQCKNGMMTSASPIIIDGYHLANVFIGQFHLKEPDLDFFRRQVRECGFDESEYLAVVREAPVMPQAKLPSILGFLTGFAKMVGTLSLERQRAVKAAKVIEQHLRERKRMEEELLRSERLAVLGKMAAHISHEIKNPLMLIGGFARQVLKNIDQPPEKNQEKLQIIVDEVHRLEDFLVEVGSYAKFSEPQKRPGDLNTLVQETCQRLEPTLKESNVDLVMQLAPRLPGTTFDPDHLRQVILNITKNGIEAMDAGGTLTITTGRQADRVFLQISDTGSGIPPEIQEKIFQPFFSSKPKGSGLGLAISQKIIQAHQGEIAIESETQKGTQVTIFLRIESQ